MSLAPNIPQVITSTHENQIHCRIYASPSVNETIYVPYFRMSGHLAPQQTRCGLHCLVHPGVWDKRRVSEVDLSQPRLETTFWWRHNGPVTSQLTDPFKWPNQPWELIEIFEHMNTHNKESLTQRCRRSANVKVCLKFLYISIWFES